MAVQYRANSPASLPPRSSANVASRSVAGHRGGNDLPRPIAAGLKLPSAHVQAIDQSHERCVAQGVSRIERPDLSRVNSPDLAIARERNLRLHTQAAPVMEMLYDQIVDSESMVVLTDASGTIIHSIGDDDFLQRASKVALQPGANWSEPKKGTNAVGTALVQEIPTLVHADEHYLHANHFLTCSAAPILDPRGNILGVLDVSGDFRSYHQHTMALVKMSARMIENRWLTDDLRNIMRLHFHSRVEFIGTLMEGILAVNADGKIVGANRGALEHLGLSGAAVRMHTLASLFGTSVGALVDHFRAPFATPAPVHHADGRQFHILARFNWPVWTSLAEAVSSAPAKVAIAGPARRNDDVAPEEKRKLLAEPQAEPQRAAEAPVSLAQLRTGDAQLDELIDKVRRVLDRDVPILIVGDTGTGKEVLARAIHADSQRCGQPFVAVNCAALPAALIEAELFGPDDGARRKGDLGKITQANGGTLFLDEIGELPLALQGQLLRVLQERRVVTSGAAKSAALNITIICATHHNLRELIKRKLFREDLFYRLNGLALRLPRLNERSDLAVLVRRILDREAPGRRLQLAPEVAVLLQHNSWPGNMRQLFNVLRTACLMAAHEPTISLRHLPDDFVEEGLAAGAAQAVTTSTPEDPLLTLDELQIEAIKRAVEQAGGNISEASKRLGISRNTIYRKLRWNQDSKTAV